MSAPTDVTRAAIDAWRLAFDPADFDDRPTLPEAITDALATAGLLRTDQEAAVIEAAKAWRDAKKQYLTVSSDRATTAREYDRCVASYTRTQAILAAAVDAHQAAVDALVAAGSTAPENTRP